MFKILIHKLFHGDKYNSLLKSFGRDRNENDYNERDIYQCSKCGVITEEFMRQDTTYSCEFYIITLGQPDYWRHYHDEKELVKLTIEELIN